MRRCLCCGSAFPANDAFQALPLGRTIAFDPARGRLWVICRRCHAWNLHPLEDRLPALEELERAARDRGEPLGGTDHVTLLRLGRVLLVRVGPAGLRERAWWRHGRELRVRRDAYASASARVTAATFGALRRVGGLLGLGDPDAPIRWDDNPRADILRWRRFGWAAWRGRERCPFCRSTLRALTYDVSWWVYPLMDEEGRTEVGVPCPRCDPWTPEKLYRIRGPEAETVLRRVLAYQNVAGAPDGVIRTAATAIEVAGSPGEFALEAARAHRSLWKLGTVGSVALEIALAESWEDRLLDLDARAVEFLWRREEELARIMDEELTPPPGVIP